MTKTPSALPFSPLQKHGLILTRGPQGAWDDGMVESPVVWWDERVGRFGMVYTGYDWRGRPMEGYASMGRPHVGLAWSDDLITWEKAGDRPIFSGSGLPDTPDQVGTAGPFVYVHDGQYYLYYFGTTEAGYEKGYKTMCLATSDDLIHWNRHPGNPIISPDAQFPWRNEAIWHPHVVASAGRFYCFFNVSGVHADHHEEFIGHAESDDLCTWTVRDDLAPLLVGSRTPGAWDATGRAGDPAVWRVGDYWWMAWYSWDGRSTQDGYAWTTHEAFPTGWQVWDENPVLRLGPPGSFDAWHAGKPHIIVHNQRWYHFYTAVDDQERRGIAVASGDLRA